MLPSLELPQKNGSFAIENLNAVFINDGLPQTERLEKLNKIAIQQMKVLENIEDRKLLTEEKK